MKRIVSMTPSTPDRRQSKTPLTIHERGSKRARNSVFDCHISPGGRQMAIENSVSDYFYLRSSIVLTFSIAAYPVWPGNTSRNMRFPTMWYVRPAKPRISLRIRTVWSEPLLVAWIFYEFKSTDRTSFGVSKLKTRLHRLVWVYTYQNATLLEITCHGSLILLPYTYTRIPLKYE